jgi:flagellar hook protein FlgE
MSSTIAMFTALSGLNASSRQLDVIGDNIANVNTNGFKASRVVFADSVNIAVRGATPPGDVSGGTNPVQIGTGVKVAGTQRDTRQGTLAPSGDARDLAIDGGGYFTVLRGTEQFYTRAGSFRLDKGNNLVTVNGDYVLGYGVDGDFQVLPGELQPIRIDLGGTTVAEATRNVSVSGNLNAAGPVATQGTRLQLAGAQGLGLSLITGATVPPGAGNVVETTSLLTEIAVAGDPTTPRFAAGQVIEVDGARRGQALVPTAQFPIDATTTLGDLLAFMSTTMGIRTGGTNPDGGVPGVALDAATGLISMEGNVGTVNDLEIDAGSIRLLNADGSVASLPFTTDRLQSAAGESVRTAFVAYDSLGTARLVELAAVLVSRDDTGTRWAYEVTSPDDTDPTTPGATGFISFDNLGRSINPQPVEATIDLTGSGALSPFVFNLNFTEEPGTLTSLAQSPSDLQVTTTDGVPAGTLQDFAIGRDGVVTGVFSNGLIRSLGQVTLAEFNNPEGLSDVGNNMYRSSPNSGPALITTPGARGSAFIIGGAIEQSNVDLGQEFISMIMASTAYSASSRVITTTDQLLQQLLVLGR